MNPAEFAIKNRLISMIVILACLIGGWMAYEKMPRFEDPEFTIRTAVIITQYPGASPEEVADEVTDPLESAIQQMQEVKKITSTSSAGVSRINVDVLFEFSPDKAALQGVWAKLRNKVGDAQGSLPPDAGTSFVNDSFGDVFGVYYMITGDGYTPKQLHTYAKQLRTSLLSAENVGKIAIGGVQSEAIYVEISRERAAALGASVQQLYSDLSKQNAVTSAGNVLVGEKRLIIQPSGDIDSVAAIENIIVSTDTNSQSSTGGALVYLKDIATVTRGYQTPTSSLVRYDGKFAISLGVANVSGTNVVAMSQAVDARLAETIGERPLGMNVQAYYNQGVIVDASVKNFAFNVGLALLIVLVVLFIFMGFRSAIIIGAVLIVTIAATLASMYYILDIPMHRISLGALIIALGMLVDNGVVVTEGILVGTQQGEKKLDAAKRIIKRTIWPLFGGTLVGIIAFAPIGFAKGDTAEYAGSLFWVVGTSLFFSWVFAITLAPLLANVLFKEASDDGSFVAKPEGKFMRGYKAFLRGVLKIRWVAIGAVFGLFAVSVWGFSFVKSGFFPASTTPQIVVDYWLPEGTDISTTEADMISMESHFMEMDGVKKVQTLIGQGGLRYMLVYPPESPNSSYGQFLLEVEDYKKIDAMMPGIQKYVDSHFPNAQAKVWRFQLGPGGGSKIEAEFSGPDAAVLRHLAVEAKEIMQASGAISIKDDWRQPVSVIEPMYSETRGRRLGISREDLANALQSNFSGRNVGVYREGTDLIPIIARAPANERHDAVGMADIQISSQITGGTVPLIETVDGFKTIWRDGQLLRKNRVLTIKAQSDPIVGELASTLLARIRPKVEAIELPAGYSLTWRGQYGNSQDANGALATTLPMGFIAMVLVVIFLFNALRQALVIWLIVPLALIGVVAGLLLTNTAMEFMAILGLLSLSGLLIKNGIVLVAEMDDEIKDGKPRLDAIVDAAASRVRPVMLGSFTTVLGVIPLLGDAFFKSMSVVLVFGLSFATVLTLVVAPALYAVIFRIRNDERAA